MREHFFSKFPFGYAQNVVILSGVTGVGLFIEGIFRGNGVWIPSFPWNWMVLCLQILLGIVFVFFPFFKKVKEWLTSVPFVVVSSLFLVFFVLLSGFIPQPQEEGFHLLRYLGLTHIVRSWYFVFIFFLVSFSLELIVIKRWSFKKLKDFAFLLNHLGILIVILAAFWGASDLRRVLIELHPEELIWSGVDQKGRNIDFPFALKLKEFRIDEYKPQIVFFDTQTQKIHPFKAIHLAEVSGSFLEKGWKITTLEYKPYVWYFEGKLVDSKQWGSPSAALVEAKNEQTGERQKGWLSTSTKTQEAKILMLSTRENLALALIDGRPKRFSSDFFWYTPQGAKGEGQVQVNKPFSLEGWKIYQYGYDETAGRWSQMTVLEAVRDPWLPFVYLGLVMTLIGVFLFIWTGKENES